MKRIAVVLGSGGHTAQTFSLVDLLGPQFYYIYMVGFMDRLTPTKIQHKGTLLRVLTPRLRPEDSRVMSAIRTVTTLLLSLFYFLIFRPCVVVSCGTGMTVPVFYSARFLGIRTVFIESLSRVKSLSKTGELLLGNTTLFLVQWESLAEKLPGATYGGQLL
jgi:beta-1,4-N-acetylglucosaminyltransferase